MEGITKVKAWINEHVPMLSNLYENKYVGMVYDRFASLHPKQQKQVILGALAGILAMIVGYIVASYVQLWSQSGKLQESNEMIALLQQYQKTQRQQSTSIGALERSNRLASPDELKKLVYSYGSSAAISPRMIKVEQKAEATPPAGGEDSKSTDIQVKQATITLEKINLRQLKAFLTNLEFNEPNLAISSVAVKNDDKIRGYMNVVFGVVLYLFKMEQG